MKLLTLCEMYQICHAMNGKRLGSDIESKVVSILDKVHQSEKKANSIREQELSTLMESITKPYEFIIMVACMHELNKTHHVKFVLDYFKSQYTNHLSVFDVYEEQHSYLSSAKSFLYKAFPEIIRKHMIHEREQKYYKSNVTFGTEVKSYMFSADSEEKIYHYLYKMQQRYQSFCAAQNTHTLSRPAYKTDDTFEYDLVWLSTGYLIMGVGQDVKIVNL